MIIKNYIPKMNLIDGAYYNGRCRNASEARWSSKWDCFVHYRTKFNATFLEAIHAPEDENIYDVFYAISIQLIPKYPFIWPNKCPSGLSSYNSDK